MQACQAAAKVTEAASVQAVKALYQNFLNPVGNVDIIFDGSWKTCGHKSNIAVGCILELYSDPVLDHVVLFRYCRGCQGTPDPDDDDHGVWVLNHKCLKNVDCNAGWMEAEAPLILFKRFLEKNELRYTTALSDRGSHTFRALTQEDIYGCLKIKKKHCLNRVNKWMGAALCTLVEKKAQGESFGGKEKLTRDKIKKITNYYGVSLQRCLLAKTSKPVAEQLGYSSGSCLIRRSLKKDKQRLRKADKAHTKSEKVKKMMAKRHKSDRIQDYWPGLK
ncbi:hypothetical protein HPB47_001718 [Ixodes persulcatus]|uniref:Uncharacterized protein n=1 Tax=Ixodes persulcatus TaxID=34615 RepID=A0AC60PN97_IXOPE|nr:hypothetical protein HPB47_001718 [Ixodes persulcatus]